MMMFQKPKTHIGIILLSACSYCSDLTAGCLSAQSPYENHLGWAIFPFTNSCSEDVTVSLCVKSWPPGSSEPAFNSYGGVVPANDRLEITDGMWRTYDSYRWQENAAQTCPFE
jgi:hypothetical protein